MTFLIVWNFIKAVWFVFAEFFGKSRPAAEPVRYRTAAWITAAGLVLLLVLASGVIARRWWIGRRIEATAGAVAETKTAAIESQSRSEVLEEKQKENDDEKILLKEQSVQTAGNFNAAVRRDSGTRRSDFGAVKRKWCEDHPDDSKCRKL